MNFLPFESTYFWESLKYFTLGFLKVQFLTLFDTVFQIIIITETQNWCSQQSPNN